MIKKYKFKKIICILALCILFYSGNIKKVYGEISVKVDWGNYSDSKDQTDGDGDGIPGGGDTSCGGGIHVYCDVSRGAEIWSNVYGDMYDMYGNKIGDIFTLKDIQPFLAGTYVGLDIYEDKGYNSWASYKVSAVKITYHCRKKIGCAQWNQCKNPNYPNSSRKEYISCEPCLHDLYDTQPTYEEGCPSGYELYDYTKESATACGAAVANCSAKAKPPVLDVGGPSYKITYNDSNDIDTKEINKMDKYNTIDTIVAKNCTGGDIIPNDGKNTRSKTCTYTYNREKTCINVKNGKVRYINKENNCLEDEYELAYNGEYWKYFIPLNSSSKDDFSLLMEANDDTIQDEKICKAIIDKYDNYADLIVTLSKGKLPGIIADMRPVQIKRTKQDAKDLVEGGCRYSSIINIPVVQRFYNELDNGINFKGFNFYYKPIDINNPFPNGLTDTSIWNEWNEDKDKEPDIEDSYKQVTYIANTNGNENKIRNYTKDNPYTSWKNMNVDGYSYFIKNEGIVEKIDKTSNNKFYKLGCGPWNENPKNDDGSKNYFYQPECGDTK